MTDMSLVTIVETELEKFRSLLVSKLGGKIESDVVDDLHADLDQVKAQVTEQMAAAGHDVTADAAQVASQAGAVASETAAEVEPNPPTAAS
jgi:hypothetical protein